ncbi:unnamed protein product [Acanthoscelides obtectus]|uniref:Uncharacterized protein n=2 Tax=Acanthoscelides obtectus TaxID=200917 RepID=A0A9P0P603_ACAOB|nr:unnamed protein product [Acanthoscelides obtectus]CAK1652361.1 hypothetical protein AOBTE_LOCUS17807 [Acanthoscelides obtectus]
MRGSDEQIMQKPVLPLSLLNDLRCVHCEKFVSCGPVYVVTPSKTILCGRCRMFAKPVYRNVSYEALASMFQYNCNNWEVHCPKILFWNESRNHEDECTYGTFCSRFWRHPCTCCRSRRDIPLGDIRLVPIFEPLLDYIRCVSCNYFLSCEPVYILPNGKNVCHRCIHANGFPPNGIHNVFYETLANIVIFPCIFRGRGCPTMLKFGKDLWEHETQCSYNTSFAKAQKSQQQERNKERGVIQTHSGHHFGTLSPNNVPMAPPRKDSDFDLQKQLVKSIKKQQERRHLRAEEIESQFDRRSVDTDGSHKSIDDKGSSSRASTLSRHEEEEIQKHFAFLDRPESTDSGLSIYSIPSDDPKNRTLAGKNPYQFERAIGRSESILSSRELLAELKVKQHRLRRTHL